MGIGLNGTIGMGTKKKAPKRKAQKKGKGLLLGKNSPFKNVPLSKHSIVKPKFHKNVPLSNYDLIKWCKYLDIPIKDVSVSR